MPHKKRPRALAAHAGGNNAGCRNNTPTPAPPQVSSFLPPSHQRFRHVHLSVEDRAMLHSLLCLMHRHINRGLPDRAAYTARQAARLVSEGLES